MIMISLYVFSFIIKVVYPFSRLNSDNSTFQNVNYNEGCYNNDFFIVDFNKVYCLA